MATELLSSCPQSKQLNPENASLPGSLLTRRQAALLMMDGECGSLMSLENSRVLRLRGRCDSYMLREELSRIFARCPELRTSFVRTSSGDYEPLTPTEERVDFGCLAVEAKDESSMRAALLREAMMPLSLEGGPLFRARLISACSEESYLLLTAHPAVADGYSLSVILVELIGRLSLTEGMEVLSGEALHRSLLVREAAMAQGVEAGKLHGYWEEMADKLEGFGEALTPVADGEVRARTGDIVSQDEQGLLSYRGRTKSVINCGGNKVYPEEVEEVLRSHPGVQQARVLGESHPLLGSPPLWYILEITPAQREPLGRYTSIPASVAEEFSRGSEQALGRLERVESTVY